VHVKVQEVLEWKLPELSLEVCRQVLADVQSIDEFKEKAREAIRNDASIEFQARMPAAVA
jgi:hypothetical protein